MVYQRHGTPPPQRPKAGDLAIIRPNHGERKGVRRSGARRLVIGGLDIRGKRRLDWRAWLRIEGREADKTGDKSTDMRLPGNVRLDTRQGKPRQRRQPVVDEPYGKEYEHAAITQHRRERL